MNILFISQDVPINTFSGGAIRSHFMFRELCMMGNVSVVTANDFGVDHDCAEDFSKSNCYLGHIELYCDPGENARSQELSHGNLSALADLPSYDMIVVRYYWLVTALRLVGQNNLVLDCDDCMLELVRSDGAGSAAQAKKRQYIKDLSMIPLVLFARKSTKMAWQAHFRIYGNCVSKSQSVGRRESVSAYRHKSTVLFVGNLSYAPNYEGLDRFISKVWRYVEKGRDDIELKVVGWGLPPQYKRKWESVSSVRCCGYVEDINDVYSDVDLAISPIWIGSGTHIKIMESLMHRTTMIITKWSHRGYEDTLLDGESLLVANNDSDFRDKLIYLIDNKDVCRQLANQGYNQVAAYHSYERTSGDLAKMLFEHCRSLFVDFK